MDRIGSNLKFVRHAAVATLFAGIAAAGWGQTKLIPLEAGGRVVARYEPGAAPMKPYVKELFSPAGVEVTVDSPPDHFHHHGLMFAIGAGDTDFWTEKPFEKNGRQVPRAGTTVAAPGGVKQTVDWLGTNGAPLLVEARSVRVATVAGGPNLVTWISELRPAGKDAVRLWGRHYFGLGLRFVPDLNGERIAWIFREGTPEGRLVRGDERVRPAAWAAATGTIGGKPVTLAMWGGSRDECGATEWFTMTKPFSYLAATLDLENHPRLLAAGETLALRYGVAVFDGAAGAAEICNACQTWLAAEEAVGKRTGEAPWKRRAAPSKRPD